MHETEFFKKKDLIVIALLLIFAAVFYVFAMPTEVKTKAEITVDGVHYKTVDLLKTENGIYEIEGVNVSYEVRDGKIAFHESDCDDKVCINGGFISMGGQSNVCLPNKVVISIPRGDDGGVDIMLG